MNNLKKKAVAGLLLTVTLVGAGASVSSPAFARGGDDNPKAAAHHK